MQNPISQQEVDDLNTIISFLSRRDVERLDNESLKKEYDFAKADLIILSGSSILCSIHTAALAYKNGLAKKFMIVGGIGHSTKYLIENVQQHAVYRNSETAEKPEANIFKDILVNYFGIDENEIIIENKSTNCGNNAEFALNIANEHSLQPHSIILVQDPTMQLRTHASFLRHWTNPAFTFINFAPLIPLLRLANGKLGFDNETDSSWSIERFLPLIMGEIARLQDNENGYGPKGKNFIAHIDIPEKLMDAYKRLEPVYSTFREMRNF